MGLIIDMTAPTTAKVKLFRKLQPELKDVMLDALEDAVGVPVEIHETADIREGELLREEGGLSFVLVRIDEQFVLPKAT